MNELQKNRADRITELHAEIGAQLRTTLDKAIEIGELLTAQKADLEHGAWLPWLQENAPFAERTAREYMRFYDRRDEIKTAQCADFTDARNLLAPPAQDPNPKENWSDKEWAEYIQEAATEATKSIILKCKRLCDVNQECKEKYSKSDFIEFAENQMGYKTGDLRKMIAVGGKADELIPIAHRIEPDIDTLYEYVRLSDDEKKELFDSLLTRKLQAEKQTSYNGGHLIPPAGTVGVITGIEHGDGKPRIAEMVIANCKTPGYVVRQWIELDDFDGSTAIYDKRGVNTDYAFEGFNVSNAELQVLAAGARDLLMFADVSNTDVAE